MAKRPAEDAPVHRFDDAVEPPAVRALGRQAAEHARAQRRGERERDEQRDHDRDRDREPEAVEEAPHPPGHVLDGDIDVVAAGLLRRRSEDWVGQAIGLPHSLRQPDAADALLGKPVPPDRTPAIACRTVSYK